MKAPKIAGIAGIALAVGMVASACSMTSDSVAHDDPPAPVDCQPQFPKKLQGVSSYYAVVLQMMNCQSSDIPLMVDYDLQAGTGTSLKAVGGVDAQGTGVVWDNGSGTSQSPATSVPKGDGQGGYGKLVGFTTVPHWNGTRGDSPGPYDATTNKDKDRMDPNFSGSWTVYTPSSMLQFFVFTTTPWAYTPEYFDSDDPAKNPGELGTGVFLIRQQEGGGQIPIFTQSSDSQSSPSQSPPDSSFVPTTCWDPLVLVNGAEPNPAVGPASGFVNPSDWSYQITADSNTWTMTPAGNDYLPLSEEFPGAPPVMLTNGLVDTNGGQDTEIALRNDRNASQSKSPHYVQAYYRVMANQKCSGSTSQIKNAVAIGADLSSIDFSFANAGGAVFANSSLSGANLTAATFVGGEDGNLAYADLSDSSGTPAKLSGAVLQGANLTGANLTNAQVNKLDLNDAKLLSTNLSGISPDEWKTVLQGGTLYCHTILPGTTEPNDSNCDTLLKDQDTDWSHAGSAQCVPGTCVFVSLYNNSTRTLAKGFSQCLVGEDHAIEGQGGPAFIAPLETGKWGWEVKPGQDPEDKTKNVIHCGQTYANGAGGKIQVVAQTDGTTPATLTANDGACVTAGSCLPKSADGKTPLVVDVEKESRVDGTFYDITVCDATASTAPGRCPTHAALPNPKP